MRTIYKPSEYYQRALDSLKRTAQEVPEPARVKILSGVAAFARLIVKLGVLDRERQEFWRFLGRTIAQSSRSVSRFDAPGSDGLSLSEVE